jgi:hypothetical protein
MGNGNGWPRLIDIDIAVAASVATNKKRIAIFINLFPPILLFSELRKNCH